MSFAVVFPGQGSQSAGMLSSLAATYDVVEQTFSQASQVLGYDLWALLQDAKNDSHKAEQLNQTQITQPLMLTAGMSVWRVFSSQINQQPVVMAGHSLGEYTAFTASGVFEFEQAIKLVEKRAKWMQEAVEPADGAMAAVLGVEDAVILEVCAGLSRNLFTVEPVNFNALGQVVIAGHVQAVNEACVQLKERGARRAMVLPVSVPSHSSLMDEVAIKLLDEIASLDVSDFSVPVIQNVNAKYVDDVEQSVRFLAAQVNSPVQWVKTVNQIAKQTDTIIELGGGKVLTGLNKRIDQSLTLAHVDSPESLSAALDQLSD